MDPERFIAAQDPVWTQVLAELSNGRKATHWIWFVFPQLAALGQSARAKHFGLASVGDARVYDMHPVLGPRLRTALSVARGSGEADPVALFGPVDAMKFRSCLTLFEAASAAPEPFEAGLNHFFDGARDGSTLELLSRS